MKASDIIRKLNKLGGENGIGLLDIVENRLVGMKDRGVYETPGGTILYKAHECLEMITIDKDTAHMKSKLAVDFADLVYNCLLYTSCCYVKDIIRPGKKQCKKANSIFVHNVP